MHTFFSENLPESEILDEVESKHAVRVLRLREGDTIRVVNGEGVEVFATIIDAHPKRCSFEVVRKVEHPREQNEIAIAIAPTKSNERIEWFLEKAVEIGITSFIPLICQNSERKKYKEQRWENVIIKALKQSGRVWKPSIFPIIKFSKFVTENNFSGVKFIAYCGDEFKKENFKEKVTSSENQLILIGPEGDFSPSEAALALENNFQNVTLGQNRLRTETAGVVACTLMKFA